MATNGNQEELSPKQRAAIAALVAGTPRGVLGASEKAGVSEQALHRWLKQPAFRAALAAAQEDAIGVAVRELTGLAALAVEVLRGVMDDSTASDGVRVRAAVAALELLLRLRDSVEFERRLAALEEGQGGARWHDS